MKVDYNHAQSKEKAKLYAKAADCNTKDSLFPMYMYKVLRSQSNHEHRMSRKELGDAILTTYGIEKGRKAFAANLLGLLSMFKDIHRDGEAYWWEPYSEYCKRVNVSSFSADVPKDFAPPCCAPAAIYDILMKNTNEVMHLEVQEIAVELDKKPYYLEVQRQAISRILNTMSKYESNVFYHPNHGAWYKPE